MAARLSCLLPLLLLSTTDRRGRDVFLLQQKWCGVSELFFGSVALFLASIFLSWREVKSKQLASQHFFPFGG